MPLLNWIPWQLLARKAARAYGFADPLETLNRVRSFSRPSAAHEPIELLRAGFAFHARGIANTKAIQNNLDWIWPYWIERQYDPRDISFVPRAFSFSHINLTQRNWTATGVPGYDQYAIVDPRGLVTPFHDSWSIDFWILGKDGTALFPSQQKEATQELLPEQDFAIRTSLSASGLRLVSTVRMHRNEDQSIELRINLQAMADQSSRLIASVRPYNPEGVQFIDTIAVRAKEREITVNGTQTILLPNAFEAFALSSYEHGDVSHDLELARAENLTVECRAGLSTAAAVARLPAKQRVEAEIRVPLRSAPRESLVLKPQRWKDALSKATRIHVPDAAHMRQYQISQHTLELLSPDDIYPGPYTYRRFWFRDACLIAHALLKTGQFDTCERGLLRFPDRQTRSGYFLSQEGEWDSNGQVLWIYERYQTLSGRPLPESCFKSIRPAIDWIAQKLLNAPDTLHHGLYPAGFSAEHFGPNDHYYWDDFWAVAGLRAAATLLEQKGDAAGAADARRKAQTLLDCIERSLETVKSKRARGKLPASPYRRMDSGAIGSLVADYPLQIWGADDERIQKTASYLYENCVIGEAFFQDMIHSGLNIYLTLDLAQTFLRAGDPRWQPLAQRCLELASPTGQWPEAVHPRTLGGCMGDGQHAWAAAEWILFAINRLCREEGETLIVGSGISEEWIQSGEVISIEDLPTRFGAVTLRIDTANPDALQVEVQRAGSRGPAPRVALRIPGYTEFEGSGAFRAELTPLHENTFRS